MAEPIAARPSALTVQLAVGSLLDRLPLGKAAHLLGPQPRAYRVEELT